MYCSDSECLTLTSCGAEMEVSVFFDSEELPPPQKIRLSTKALFGGLVWKPLEVVRADLLHPARAVHGDRLQVGPVFGFEYQQPPVQHVPDD